MANPSQDSFMDDADDSCPLCVEDFDLSDRSFRPCPCGYQVCQFCYNNIKQNMNGLCPACRRPYDDKNIQWKVISPEEAKADVAAQARKKALARQKEAERRQVESQNRKHLAGLRVLQKNLVYIIGMNIPSSEDHVLETLRGPNHFGQYGQIIKILVSKNKEGQPLGIYVTFVDKDDAATCISALNGVSHEGRALRAQYGTNKYCSAFLRTENCNNRNCMFLHETGEASDSFSRQDLSSFNALSTQRTAGSGKGDILHPPKHQAPASAQQVLPAMPPASGSNYPKSDAMSRSDSGEGSALPNTANWAKHPGVEQSKKSGQSTNRSTPSPKATNAKAVTSRPQSRATRRSSTNSKELPSIAKAEAIDENPSSPSPAPKPLSHPTIQRLEEGIRSLSTFNFHRVFDRSQFDDDTLRYIDNCPPLIDLEMGYKRYALKLQRERERASKGEETKDLLGPSTEDEEPFAAGSLQLGGEPDAFDDQSDAFSNALSSRRPYGSSLDRSQVFGNPSNATEFSAVGGRSLTPQQQRNIQLLKSSNTNSDSQLEQFQRPLGNTSQHQSQLSNPFQSQNQQLSNLSRHGRQSSRYSFAGDSANPLATVKPTSSAQMMQHPGGHSKAFGGQGSAQSNIYSNNYSNIQGPPPGLRSSGTPPISGGGMFGQGHGFTSGVGGSSLGNFSGIHVAPKGNNEDIMREMLRSRGGPGATGISDIGKLDLSDPSILQARMHHTGATQNYGIGGQDSLEYVSESILMDAKESELNEEYRADRISAGGTNASSRRATPAVPPGIPLAEFPPLSTSRLSSSQPVHQQLSHDPEIAEQASRRVFPAVPRLDSISGLSSASKDPLGKPDVTELSETVVAHIGSKPENDIPTPKSKRGDREREDGNAWKPSKESAEPKKDRAAPKQSNASKPDAVSSIQHTTDAPPASATLSKTENKSAASSNAATSTTVASNSQPAPSTVRQPRTLRLIQTVDTDVSQNAATLPGNSTMAPVPGSRQQSGDRSSAHPSTPARESHSETMSIASNPVSRPPSAHGERTQSKQRPTPKKEMQNKMKPNDEEKAAHRSSKPVMDEVVQAPIIGRKKKSKKPKTQAASRAIEESHPLSPANIESVAEPVADAPKETVEAESVAGDVAAHDSDNAEAPPTVTSLPTIASIVSHLQKQGELGRQIMDWFSTPPGFHHRPEPSTASSGKAQIDPDITLTKKQMANLERNQPVVVRVNAQEVAMVLPSHAVLRHLSHEEAASYLSTWHEISKDDPAFLTSTVLPSVHTMDAAWKHAMSTPLSSTGYGMTSQVVGHGSVSDLLSLSTLGNGDDALPSTSIEATSSHRCIDPSALAAEMENMTLEDAQQALATAEEMLKQARVVMESEERRLMAIARRNRKAIRG